MSWPDDHQPSDIEKSVMQHIYANIGFIPVFRGDLESEEDYEAQQEDLPLSVLWNERDSGGSASFTLSINPYRIAEIYSQFGDLTSWDQIQPLHHAIHRVSLAAVADLSSKSGKRPSQVCLDYWERGIQ